MRLGRAASEARRQGPSARLAEEGRGVQEQHRTALDRRIAEALWVEDALRRSSSWPVVLSFFRKHRGAPAAAARCLAQLREKKARARAMLADESALLASALQAAASVQSRTHALVQQPGDVFVARLVRFDERAPMVRALNAAAASSCAQLLRARRDLGARGDARPHAAGKVVAGGVWVPQLAPSGGDGGWTTPATSRPEDEEAAKMHDARIAVVVEALVQLGDSATRAALAQHAPGGVDDALLFGFTTFTVCTSPWAAMHTDAVDSKDEQADARRGLIVMFEGHDDL